LIYFLGPTAGVADIVENSLLKIKTAAVKAAVFSKN